MRYERSKNDRSRSTPHERVRNGRLSQATVGVIVVEALYVLWLSSRGYFYQDDFINFYVTRQLGFGGGLLEHSVFGEFIPGYNVVNYIVASVTPYRWPIVEVADVVLFLLSLTLLYRLLGTLFGPTWLNLALVSIAGASFSLVPSLVWWASGLQQLVAISATLLAIDSHARFVSTGRPRHAVVGGLALAVGLAFYEEVFVSALFIVLLTVLFWPPAPGVRGALQSLTAYWPAWLCQWVPAGLDLGWRFAHLANYSTPPLPTAGQALQFIFLQWTQTFVPLVFGVDAWLLASHFWRVAAGTIGQAIALLAIVRTSILRPLAWRAWVLFATTFLTTACLYGLTRVSVFGASFASYVVNVTLDVFFFVITVGLALLPLSRRALHPRRAAVQAAAVTERRHSPSPMRVSGGRKRVVVSQGRLALWAIGIPALCAVVALYVVALDFDQDRNTNVQGDYASRRFFTTFAASWPRATSKVPHPFLWDTEISPIVVSHAFYPYDTAAVTVGMLHTGLHFDVWGGAGYLLGSDGSVVPAVTVTEAIGVLHAVPGVCVATGAVPAGISVSLNHALGAQRWFGLISYRSSTGAVVSESGGATVTFARGKGTVITTFPPTPMSSVAWGVPPHRQLCITELKIVLPRPAEKTNLALHPLGASRPSIGKYP